jgi:hypothetical protein
MVQNDYEANTMSSLVDTTFAACKYLKTSSGAFNNGMLQLALLGLTLSAVFVLQTEYNILKTGSVSIFRGEKVKKYH